MLVSERIHICLQYCCPTNVRCWKCQDRSGLCLPLKWKRLPMLKFILFVSTYCIRQLAFLQFGRAPVSEALSVKPPSHWVCNFLFCLQRERVLHGESKHEVEKIWLWWRMSGQLGMCISFFIQIVLRSFLPLFHPLSPNLPLPDTIISYHIMRLFLEGPLTVFLCEKHITVFLLLNVTEPTFALCSILISDPYFAMCCKEMPLATHSCNGRQ